MGIEDVVIDLIEGRRKSKVLQGSLYFLSLLYQMATKVRNILYDHKILKTHKSSLPVISIGNLVAGGTGKTPFVQKLAHELSQIPGEVAIVTRGYRSQAECRSLLASHGEGPLVSATICGDEAYWLALKTKASLWVGKNRLENLVKIEKTSAFSIVR
jgi:tetraacyldisaccharide 4'-kinase